MSESGPQTPVSPVEKAPKPPVYLVYRENNLYKEYVPKLIVNLKAQGYEVETHAFPQGTGSEEISEWLKQNEETFAGKKFFADQTVVKQAAFDADKRSLDESFASAATELLTEDVPRDGDKELIVDRIPAEHTERLFAQLFKEAYEKDRPSKIYIAENSLEDHSLFGDPAEVRAREEEAADVAKRLKDILVGAGVPGDVIDILPQRLDRAEEFARAAKRKSYEDRGMDKEDIEFMLADPLSKDEINRYKYEASILPGEIPVLDQEGTWIIGDRHYIPRLEKGVSKARIIQLPLSNLIFSLVANGLVSAPTQEFEEKLGVCADETLSRVSLGPL